MLTHYFSQNGIFSLIASQNPTDTLYSSGCPLPGQFITSITGNILVLTDRSMLGGQTTPFPLKMRLSFQRLVTSFRQGFGRP